MSEESSFQKGFGGGCGLILGVLLALILIPAVLFGGCVMLGIGGAAAVGTARDAARQAMEKQAAEAAAKTPTTTGTDVEAAAEWRTWTDATGKHSTEARLLGVTDGRAELEKRDGTTVNLPLEKLSEADLEFLRQQEPTPEPRP